METNMPVVSIDINMFWQIINFFILLVIFNKFLRKPLEKMLNSRKEAITNNISQAEEAKKLSEKDKAESELILKNARKEASSIIVVAEKKAYDEQERIIKEAREQREKLIKDAEHEAEKMREQLKRELSNSLRETAAMMAAEVLSKKLDNKGKETLLNEFIEEVGEVKW